ncbi:MAG: hypothetical protein HKL82_09425 [Acidimicrobiaceae bacterium]|nr:hypothetical protein [Acidimicrobiaceae bacterium]
MFAIEFMSEAEKCRWDLSARFITSNRESNGTYGVHRISSELAALCVNLDVDTFSSVISEDEIVKKGRELRKCREKHRHLR